MEQMSTSRTERLQLTEPQTDVVITTRIVIASAPPDYGINSFDQLLETATNDSTGS
jgi:hypothetical protein